MFEDFLGNEIGLGDIVVYSVQHGHSVSLRCGKVIKFNPKSVRVEHIAHGNKYDWFTGESNLTKMENVVVLKKNA